MTIILYIIACPLFLAAMVAHIYVKIRMRPSEDDLDECYHEFEDSHPAVAKYTKWSRITFAVAIIAVLLMFLAMVL